jgi:hypothetical protein
VLEHVAAKRCCFTIKVVWVGHGIVNCNKNDINTPTPYIVTFATIKCGKTCVNRKLEFVGVAHVSGTEISVVL